MIRDPEYQVYCQVNSDPLQTGTVVLKVTSQTDRLEVMSQTDRLEVMSQTDRLDRTVDSNETGGAWLALLSFVINLSKFRFCFLLCDDA